MSALSEQSRRSIGRVLAVALDADVQGSHGLRSAVAAGEQRAEADRCGLTVLATYGLSSLLRGMAAAFPAPALTASDDELRAEAERHVRGTIALVSQDIPLIWRCVAQPACVAPKSELAETPYVHVVIGCTGTRQSRRLVHRLVRTAERCGTSTSVAGPPASVAEVPFPAAGPKDATSVHLI